MLLALVIACFTLSGFAALLYQTAWMRLFAIAFGTSEIAVAIVLAGYMAGLAAGAAVAARYVDRVRRPVLVYGVLEGAIALAALCLPALVGVTSQLYSWLVGGQAVPPDASAHGQSLYYSVAAVLVLLVPTGLMGATLPLLARYAVTSNSNLGSRVSLLYAMNTLGAVAGTLAAGFVLLPALGLRGTVWVGVLTNALVFVLAVAVARIPGRPAATGAPAALGTAPAGVRFILPLIALSGVLSFVYEVLWTRMLSHVLGSSIYAFATMLAAFLTGIVIGAAGAGAFARNPRQATLLFAAAQFAIAIASAFVYARIQHWVPTGLGHAALAFAVILPSAMFIGATYPLAVRAHAGNVADAGRSSAIVYSWNTIGAIAGALLAGFVVIPGLGFEGTARFAVIANASLGLVALLLCLRVPSWQPPGRLPLAGAVAALAALVVVFQPGRPDAIVLRALFGGSGEPALREIYYAVGRSSTVLLTENAYRFDLSTNGLPEAQIEFAGSPPLVFSQRWLGLWPTLARPDADSMLVVGLGGGVVLEGVSPGIGTLHTVELEAEVIAANEKISGRRFIDPLANDALRLVVNDARNALRLTGRRYDAIVSQPSHPWTAGASHLFTREFFALVKSRLEPDGVFVQWMNAEFLDEALLRELAATLLSEFDHVRIYQPSALALHFVASNGEIDIENRMRPGSAHLARNGIQTVDQVTATLLLDEEGVRRLAEGRTLITDDDNRMAVDSNVRAAGIGLQELTRIVADADPLTSADKRLRLGLADIDLPAVALRMLYDGQYTRVATLRDSVSRAPVRELLQALLLRYEGRYEEAALVLAQAQPGEPEFDQAVFLRVVDKLPGIARGDDDTSVLDAAVGSSDLAPVFDGVRLLAHGDWQALRALDESLAGVRADALWSPWAAYLRAAWRVETNSPAFAEEAMALLDTGIVTRETTEAYALRVRAAAKTGDAAATVESIAFFVRMVDNRLWAVDFYGLALEPGERRWILGLTRDFRQLLAQQADPGVAARAATVAVELRRIESSL